MCARSDNAADKMGSIAFDSGSEPISVAPPVAVLFLVFNRPATTQRVFDAIRLARPPRLYVAGDGARPCNEDEARRVAEVRRIATAVDWPCEVVTLFRESNLGCREAVSRAISWFFDQEECGIILEDDCLPHPDFFGFCKALLDHYRNDGRVMAITGDNFQGGRVIGDGSYYFSVYNHVWGWASWRRAWAHYDVAMTYWPEWSESPHWLELFDDEVVRQYWRAVFELSYAGRIDTWDYQWTACIWRRNGLTATPNVNLVSNIGFGEGATHTTGNASKQAAMATQPLGPIVHPTVLRPDTAADRRVFDQVFGGRNLRFPRSLLRPARGLARRLLQFLRQFEGKRRHV